MLWFNGVFLDDNDAQIAATSAGNLLGWGVFTTIGVWNARPFALELHLKRLRHDAQRTQIEIAFDEQTLRDAVRKVLEANQIARGLLRLTLTQRGDGRWNSTAQSDFSIVVQPISSTRNDDLRVALSLYYLHSQRPTSGLKTTSYLDYQMAWRDAQRRGFDEAILRNEREELVEGARANLFVVRDGTLWTPPLSSGCLPGIARQLVLGWARDFQIPTCEDNLHLADLQSADEAFLTSSATGIRVVTQFFDGITTRHFHQKNIAMQLHERWQNEAERL